MPERTKIAFHDVMGYLSTNWNDQGVVVEQESRKMVLNRKADVQKAYDDLSTFQSSGTIQLNDCPEPAAVDKKWAVYRYQFKMQEHFIPLVSQKMHAMNKTNKPKEPYKFTHQQLSKNPSSFPEGYADAEGH